ncbi:competence type IV pilus major pilin ComGC [Lactiplantibacillus fabifermentans]|uniref:ComG operon protein 3 n=2 Tax=Lactiplantibacillus fabifermentans TaxID=483011 RepID=A0A0R2NLX3_9LACO|nr:competence type IV pilus major pilin ComGC [Lactiplantibacillus fabifermentans]ETY73809.1 secretion protein [Lactiplantibacillus fabifermentans T30PCM01]KRO25826.1 hypothetical protein DY78_GL001129 [Lactiplantibacillus fabifermentans DSM 21115]
MNYVKRMLLKTTAPRKGFTLLEMVVVLGIIALLMLIVIPNLNASRQRAETKRNEALTKVVNGQAAMYLNDNPGKKSVTVDQLFEAHYLTESQKNQASDQQIKVSQDGTSVTAPSHVKN